MWCEKRRAKLPGRQVNPRPSPGAPFARVPRPQKIAGQPSPLAAALGGRTRCPLISPHRRTATAACSRRGGGSPTLCPCTVTPRRTRRTPVVGRRRGGGGERTRLSGARWRGRKHVRARPVQGTPAPLQAQTGARVRSASSILSRLLVDILSERLCPRLVVLHIDPLGPWPGLRDVNLRVYGAAKPEVRGNRNTSSQRRLVRGYSIVAAAAVICLLRSVATRESHSRRQCARLLPEGEAAARVVHEALLAEAVLHLLRRRHHLREI